MILLNNQPINITKFPDGTTQVWKLDEHLLDCPVANVVWEFTHEGEFMYLAQLKELLDHYDIESTLYLPFLPYARQDKPIGNNTTFALKTFVKLLNSLSFRKVVILDPHSDEAKSVNNHLFHYPVARVRQTMRIVNADCILFPDHGAFNRYESIYDFCPDTLVGEKARDQHTGQLTQMRIPGIHHKYRRRVLIVDDICDGGATFSLAANTLKPYAEDINLFVTHGIFSKGLRPLIDSGFKRIFTAKGEAIEIQNQIAFKPYEEIL